MAKLTKDTTPELVPIRNSQSQARKARQAIPACKCKIRHDIPAYQAQTSYSSMNSKRHCIKGDTRPQNSGIAETAEIAVGVRRDQY